MTLLGGPEDSVVLERETAAGPPNDPLLAELAGAEAAAIRAAQDELIRTVPESVLVIQGGPGTGRTGTALRRVAWLLGDPDLALTTGQVLVVGPSPGFARHTRALLDGWGHEGVAHSSIDELLPKAVTGRPEPPHVTRLKGEARMAGLLARALERHRERPADLPAEVLVRGQQVRLDPATVRRVIATAKASEATAGDRRRLLRAALVSGTQDPRLVLDAADQLADLLWPEFDAATFLTGLFGSRELLAEAAEGEFTDREIDALGRAGVREPPFSDADLPLLDEAEHLSGAKPRTYAHMVVDEAQDLSPMQLRAISRRSANGSLTVVGDLAQSTGPWARDDWHDVLAHLPSEQPHVHRELRFGYRVPRQIFGLAAELLPTAAPSVQPPMTVRDGPADPVIVPVDPATRAAAVVAAAADHAADGRTVAIVCPARCRDEIEARLRAEELPWTTTAGDERGPSIILVGPHEAKGLEFQAAIVVEPGFIVDDDPRGHRLLYMALTRATSHLHLVGAREDLPATPLPEPERQPQNGAKREPQPEQEREPQREQEREPQHGAKREPQPELQREQEREPQPDPEPELEWEREPEPEWDGEPEPKQEWTREPWWDPDPEAQEHVEPAAPQPPAPPPPVPLDPALSEHINVVAHALAETLLANLTPELWPIALDRLIELISPDP